MESAEFEVYGGYVPFDLTPGPSPQERGGISDRGRFFS